MFKALSKAVRQIKPKQVPNQDVRESLLHQIAMIGGQIFGHFDIERLFYVRDEKTAVWKEGANTIYYQVVNGDILKTQNDQLAVPIDQAEARRLAKAIYVYKSLALGYVDDLSAKA